MGKKEIRKAQRKLIDWMSRRRLRNSGFTVFSHSCDGGVPHDLGQQFRSSMINLFMKAGDY